MSTYIPLHGSILKCSKLRRLSASLRVDRPRALWMMVSLWLWAMDDAPGGNLSGCDAVDIAEAMGWDGDPQYAVDALINAGGAGRSGFIDVMPDGSMTLHDWADYGGKLEAKREYNRALQRSKRSAACANGDVVATLQQQPDNVATTLQHPIEEKRREEKRREDESRPETADSTSALHSFDSEWDGGSAESSPPVGGTEPPAPRSQGEALYQHFYSTLGAECAKSAVRAEVTACHPLVKQYGLDVCKRAVEAFIASQFTPSKTLRKFASVAATWVSHVQRNGSNGHAAATAPHVQSAESFLEGVRARRAARLADGGIYDTTDV